MYIVTYWLAWSWSKVQFLNVTEPPFHGGLTLMLRESVLITWVPRCPMLTQCQYCALVKHFPRSAMFLCERQAFTSGRASLYVTVDQDIRYRRQSAYKSSHLWLQASKSSRSPRWCGDHFFSQQSLVSVSCYPKRCCILCYIGHYHTMLNMNVSFGSVVTQSVWLPHICYMKVQKTKKSFLFMELIVPAS